MKMMAAYYTEFMCLRKDSIVYLWDRIINNYRNSGDFWHCFRYACII